MFLPFFSTMMLAIEANGVIGLRMLKFAAGGAGAQEEAQRMMSEKVEAAIEAGFSLMTGGSAIDVIDRYREHVAANNLRLSTPG